jgi:hypothetical protein
MRIFASEGGRYRGFFLKQLNRQDNFILPQASVLRIPKRSTEKRPATTIDMTIVYGDNQSAEGRHDHQTGAGVLGCCVRDRPRVALAPRWRKPAPAREST